MLNKPLEDIKSCPGTYLLLVSITAVFFFEVWKSWMAPGALELFFETYSVNRSALSISGSYRFFTHIFLHSGLYHILSNSIILYLAGKTLEREIGGSRILGLFFISAFGGAFLSVISLKGAAVGASAGVMGLVAAATLLVPTDSVLNEIPLLNSFSIPVIRLMFSIILIGILIIIQEILMASMQFMRVIETSTGHIAHLGGIISASSISYIIRPEKTAESAKFASLAVIILGILFYLPSFNPYWFLCLLILLILLIYWDRAG